MKTPGVALVCLLLVLTAALCQRDPGAPAPPPYPPRTAQAAPGPEAPEPPAPPRPAVEAPAAPDAPPAAAFVVQSPSAPALTPEQKREAAVAEWAASHGYPPWIAEYVTKYEEVGMVLAAAAVLAKPLIFTAMLLIVGLGLQQLLAQTLAPARPGSSSSHEPPPKASTRAVAVSTLVSWCVAFIIASEIIGLQWFGGIMSGIGSALGGAARLVGVVLSAAAWIAVAGLVAYAAGVPSREMVLSLLGGYMLRYHANKPKAEQRFDLGGGKMGRIATIDPLQTTFTLDDGSTETRPNAWLMHEHFRWGRAGGTAQAKEA